MRNLTDRIPKVEKDGSEHGGPCPWCGGDDRFRVWPDQGAGDLGRYWCRRCGRKGDVIDFLRDYKGLTFQEACQDAGLEHLIDEAGGDGQSDVSKARSAQARQRKKRREKRRETNRRVRRIERLKPYMTPEEAARWELLCKTDHNQETATKEKRRQREEILHRCETRAKAEFHQVDRLDADTRHLE